MEFRRVLFRSEERQRALLLGEAQDGTQDAKAVPEGAELAERALRTLLVGRHELARRHAQFQGVHCQLGLNLETLRQGRKGLQIGRASVRESVWQSVYISVVADSLKKKKN